MTQFQVQTTIQAPIESVFALISNLPQYPDWLAPSGTYSNVKLLTDPPVTLGTCYQDKGPATRLEGEVIVYEPPHHITFQQETARSILGIPSRLTVRISYHLTTPANQTQVVREFYGDMQGLFRLIQPFLLPTLKRENRRILAAMKKYLEQQPK